MAGEYFLQDAEQQPPQVFDEYVLKLVSGCNMQPPEPGTLSGRQLEVVGSGGSLGCDQCYEYKGTDAWKKQPPVMGLDVVRRAAERIAEHAEAHHLSDVRIIAHGGEPLMVGPEYLDEFAAVIRDIIQTPECKVHLGIQTNGLLLTDKRMEVLEKHGFSVGLSLDGDKVANDRHRLDRLGRSTYDRVVAAARKLGRSSIDWSILTVIDTRNDPENTLEELAKLRPSGISMFPPHANHSSPPKQHADGMPLGQWQIRVFERYRNWHEYHNGEPAPFAMPIADGYLDAFLGAAPVHERIGNRFPQEIFVLPNGDIQRLDTLKSTEPGAYVMRDNVFDETDNLFDDISRRDPGFIARRMGTAALARECQQCVFKDTCGGEYYPNRYKQPETPLSPESPPEAFREAFGHPTVYCEDQMEYLRHIEGYVKQQQENAKRSKIDPAKSWRSPGGVENELRSPHGMYGLFRDIRGSCARYENFPIGSVKEAPGIAEDQGQMLIDHIKAGQCSGRLALHIMAVLHRQYGLRNRELYFQPSASLEPRDGFRTVENLTPDVNEAIVRALFSPENVFLAGMKYKLKRSEGYWLVTENAVRMHAYYHSQHVAGNSFVSPLNLSSLQSQNLLSRRLSFDDERQIASLPAEPCAIPVALPDAPGDVLVIGTDSADPQDDIEALDFVASVLSDYLTPELLKNDIEARQLNINLRPLCGVWPSTFNVEGWYPSGVPYSHPAKASHNF